MARPRKDDPSSILNPIVDAAVNQLAALIERFTVERIEAATRAARSGSFAGRKQTRRRARKLCYYPGCRNVAAPRFGMFCAALHKGISNAEKQKYRAAHERRRG